MYSQAQSLDDLDFRLSKEFWSLTNMERISILECSCTSYQEGFHAVNNAGWSLVRDFLNEKSQIRELNSEKLHKHQVGLWQLPEYDESPFEIRLIVWLYAQLHHEQGPEVAFAKGREALYGWLQDPEWSPQGLGEDWFPHLARDLSLYWPPS
ncbi:MAG: hypothetical protein OXC65_05015 [Thiotrichales bacterium]|nr:hypothetical protein [Thiotrichales bacterium]